MSEKAMDRPRAWVILPVMPEAKIMGKKTAIVVRVEAVMAMPTSPAPTMEACVGPLALLEVAVDVLDDDDGVIDEHADAQGQAAEGQEVQGVAGGVEGDEGGDDGQGDGQADDEGRPPVAEEEEDEQDGQQAALPGVGDGVRRHLLDHVALVHGHVEDRIAGDGVPERLRSPS